MNVTDLEARSFTRQTARPQRGEPALVRHLRERVGLVHELTELRRAEEGLDHGGDGSRVDQVVDIHLLGVGIDRHALFDEARHAAQTHGELVGDELADRAYAPVPEVIDVVRVTATLIQLDEVAHDGNEVVLREHRLAARDVDTQALVDLVPPYATQIVALRAEEDALQSCTGCLDVGSVSGP